MLGVPTPMQEKIQVQTEAHPVHMGLKIHTNLTSKNVTKAGLLA